MELVALTLIVLYLSVLKNYWNNGSLKDHSNSNSVCQNSDISTPNYFNYSFRLVIVALAMINQTLSQKGIPKVNLVLIKQRNGSCVYVDKENGIVKVTWVEIVDKETAIEIIHALIKMMQSGMFHKILMSRDDFTRFTDEANDWMRNFLLSNRYKFNYKISRIAGVTPDAPRANIFSNFIKTAMQVIFPGVKISNFEFEESAVAWLT